MGGTKNSTFLPTYVFKVVCFLLFQQTELILTVLKYYTKTILAIYELANLTSNSSEICYSKSCQQNLWPVARTRLHVKYVSATDFGIFFKL